MAKNGKKWQKMAIFRNFPGYPPGNGKIGKFDRLLLGGFFDFFPKVIEIWGFLEILL